MPRYFLGVDGGQSGTAAYIGDETGRFLGAGYAGPCNHVESEGGRARFTSAIEGSLREACQASGLDPATVTFEAACLGFSGGPEDKQAILEEMLRVKTMIVTNDALIGLVGATAGAPGIVTNSGTGSIALGRNRTGKTARAGGWGYIFGDEGSAFDIVRQALRAALRHEEGWGPPTRLHPVLLETIGAENANALLHLFYTRDYPRNRVAEYAVLVDEVAREGDAVARDVLLNAAQQLATLTGAVRSRLFTEGESVVACYIGNVFRSEILLERYRMLVEMEDGNRCAEAIYGPAAGALIEAYRAAGLQVELESFPRD